MQVDPFHDPLQFLSACHGRIRIRLFTFSRMAERLRGQGTVGRHELESALLFFRTSGAGHTVDEETSLFPRLHARLIEADLQEAAALVERMIAEHRSHEREFDRLEAALRAIDPTLIEGDGLPDPDAAPIACGSAHAIEAADALEAVVREYEEHIPIEDDVLYPLASRLMPADELAIVAEEMRSRRRIGRKLLG